VPFGSTTVKSFAPTKRLAFAFTVTAVGETLRTEPAVGDVLTTDVATAGEIEIKVRKITVNK
jgi:hypothetical protein